MLLGRETWEVLAWLEWFGLPMQLSGECLYQFVVVYTADVYMLQVELLQGVQPTHFSDSKLVGLQFRIKAPFKYKSG